MSRDAAVAEPGEWFAKHEDQLWRRKWRSPADWSLAYAAAMLDARLPTADRPEKGVTPLHQAVGLIQNRPVDLEGWMAESFPDS